MSKMKITDFLGREVEVTMTWQKYYNGNLRIQLWDKEGPYATLTVNFEKKLPEDCAYVDVNNTPGAEEFINKYGIGEHMGEFLFSGNYRCWYPLYKFHPEGK